VIARNSYFKLVVFGNHTKIEACERSRPDSREIRVGPNSVGKYSKPTAFRQCSVAKAVAKTRSAMHVSAPAMRQRKSAYSTMIGTLLKRFNRRLCAVWSRVIHCLSRRSKVVTLLDDISKRGAEIRERVWELLLRREYSGDLKTRVLSAYVAVALEHHEAIWLLKKAGLFGSAAAMVRIVFDTMHRFLWINRPESLDALDGSVDAGATEQQIKQAWDDELKSPPMHEMREQIKHAYFGVGVATDEQFAKIVGEFFESLKHAWPILNSYTHSGGRQIARRFSGDQVRPSYSKGETAEALNMATVTLLLLCSRSS
jgi:hypothetical protein